MGKSKSITDKEIVIVNNKPMWKSDFDKLQKEDSKSIFIGITNSSSIDYMSCGQDILLYIVKVKNNKEPKLKLENKKLYSEYEFVGNESWINGYHPDNEFYNYDSQFWDDSCESSLLKEIFVFKGGRCSTLDFEKTIENINTHFDVEFEIIGLTSFDEMYCSDYYQKSGNIYFTARNYFIEKVNEYKKSHSFGCNKKIYKLIEL